MNSRLDRLDKLVSEVCEIKNFGLLQKQIEFCDSKEPDVLFTGAYGVGKSFALCLDAVCAASEEGALIIMCRKTLVSFKMSTLKLLINEDGYSNSILKPGEYTHNRNACEIKLFGGGSIIYCGLDDYQKILSVNASAIYIDEGSEFSLVEYNALASRARKSVGINQVKIATNPANQGHFLYDMFFVNPNDKVKSITAPTYDNYFLRRSYVEERLIRANTNELDYKRKVLGLWVNSDKLVYKNFTLDKNVKDIDLGTTDFIIGVDFGFTNKCCLGLMQYNSSQLNLIEEVYESQMSLDKIVDIVKKWSRGRNVVVVVDPSAPLVIDTIKRAGIIVEPANNSVKEGISEVNSKLSIRSDTKEAGFVINPKCVNTIKEFQNYSYKNDDSEQPIKKDDHAVDMCRYCVMQLAEDKNNYFKPFCIGPRDI